jgi:hypothetical protein
LSVIAVPVDVARADLELFWRQLLARGLPLQLSNDLVHAASIMNAARARLIASNERSIADSSRAISTLQAETP